LGRRVFAILRDQSLLCDLVPRNRANEAIQTFQSMPLNAAFIQAPCELVDVSSQMLLAGFVIDAMRPTAHNGEYIFNSICGDAVTDILPLPNPNHIPPKDQGVSNTKAPLDNSPFVRLCSFNRRSQKEGAAVIRI
jgi:hypothetical protein